MFQSGSNLIISNTFVSMNSISINFELASKPRKDGRHTVIMRIAAGRSEKRRISIPIHIQKNHFNSKAKWGKWIKTSCSMHGKLNDALKHFNQEAESVQLELKNKGITVNVENVHKQLKGLTTKGQTFTEFYANVKELFKESKKANTHRRYTTAYDNLNKFMNGIDLRFEDITVGFLVRYRNHLEARGLSVNTVSKELAILRAVLYRSIKEMLFSQADNPFIQFKLKKEKTHKEKLTLEEVKHIEEVKLEVDSPLFHARNVFLFAMYNGGVRFADMSRMKWENIKNDERLEYKMGKTSSIRSFKLLSKSKEILAHYKNDDSSKFIFPILPAEAIRYNEFEMVERISIKNTYINKLLKELAKEAGITKRLTTHIARHSFADILRQKGVNLYEISKALAHSSLAITENYINSLDQASVDDAISDIFE